MRLILRSTLLLLASMTAPVAASADCSTDPSAECAVMLASGYSEMISNAPMRMGAQLELVALTAYLGEKDPNVPGLPEGVERDFRDAGTTARALRDDLSSMYLTVGDTQPSAMWRLKRIASIASIVRDEETLILALHDILDRNSRAYLKSIHNQLAYFLYVDRVKDAQALSMYMMAASAHDPEFQLSTFLRIAATYHETGHSSALPPMQARLAGEEFWDIATHDHELTLAAMAAAANNQSYTHLLEAITGTINRVDARTDVMVIEAQQDRATVARSLLEANYSDLSDPDLDPIHVVSALLYLIDRFFSD